MSDTTDAYLDSCRNKSCPEGMGTCNGLSAFFKSSNAEESCAMCSCMRGWHLHRTLIPAAVTTLPSPPSTSTSSALPHASHHLPSYEIALQHLQGNPEMSSRDLDEAQPRKRAQPSSSVASGKALDQRNSARPGPPIQARARGGQFAGSKAGAASTKAVKQLDITFVLLPSSKRVLAAGPTGVPLFESRAWTLLKAAGYVRGKSLDPGPYFGVAMCHAAKELFGTKYTDEAGEQSPRFLLLQVVPYGAGRSAFQGTLVAQTDQEGVSRMLSSIATAADAELCFIRPASLLQGTKNVIIIARPGTAPTAWHESFWNEEGLEAAGYESDDALEEAPVYDWSGSGGTYGPSAIAPKPLFNPPYAGSSSTSTSASTSFTPNFTITQKEAPYGAHHILTTYRPDPAGDDSDNSLHIANKLATNPNTSDSVNFGDYEDFVTSPFDNTLSNMERLFRNVRWFCAEAHNPLQKGKPPFAPAPWAEDLFTELRRLTRGKSGGKGSHGALVDDFIKKVYRIFPERELLGSNSFENHGMMALVGGDSGINMIFRHLLSEYEHGTLLSPPEIDLNIHRLFRHLESLVTTYRMHLSYMDWLPGSAGLLAVEVQRAESWEDPEQNAESEAHLCRQEDTIRGLKASINKALCSAASRETVEALIKGPILDGPAGVGYHRFAKQVLFFAVWFFQEGDISDDEPGPDDHPGFADLVFRLCTNTQAKLWSYLQAHNVPPYVYGKFNPFFMNPPYYKLNQIAVSHRGTFSIWGDSEGDDTGEDGTAVAHSAAIKSKGKGKAKAGDDETAAEGVEEVVTAPKQQKKRDALEAELPEDGGRKTRRSR